MYNLKAEMARRELTAKDLAGIIGKTDRAVRDKLAGESPFTLDEAFAIRDRLFPTLSVEYLFCKSPTPATF